MLQPFLVAVGIGVGILVLAGVILYYLPKRPSPLDLYNTHADFFQGYVGAVQTVFVVAGLFYVGLQTSYLTDGVKTSTVQTVTSNHRELLGKILEDPQLADALGDQPQPVVKNADTKDAKESEAETLKRRKLAVYRSMFLNHAFNTFTLRKHGYIEDEWWNAIEQDMKQLLRRQPMRDHWTEKRSLYPASFREFMDEQILSDNKEKTQ